MKDKSSLRVCVVVLNWNGIKDTEKCLDSLLGQSYEDYEILVVDNGSRDKSLNILLDLERKHPSLRVITNEFNKGFAGGVNTGINYGIKHGFDAIALFNNDAVADEQWLKELVKQLHSDRSIITGLLLNAEGSKIDSTAEVYSSWGMPFSINRGAPADQSPPPSYVFGATGGASLYRTTLFKEIGLFDESFFAYYEDVDISFRTQLAGHKVYFTNKAIAYHKQGATSSKIPGFTVYQTFKNIPLLYIKDVPTGLLLPIGIRLWLLYLLIFANAIKNGSGFPALKGWLASIWYFWTKSFWLRFGIQSSRKVSTKYINSMITHDLSPDQTGMRKFRKLFTGKA